MTLRYASHLVLLILTLPILHSNAQGSRFPDSPTGNALEAIVTALEDGTHERVGQFVDEKLDALFVKNMSREDVVQTLVGIHEAIYPFEVVAVLKTREWSAECILSAMESDEQLRISFDLSARPPHRLTGLGIEPADGMDFPAEALGELDGYLSERADDGSFSGVVLIAREGNVVFHEAYGLASKRYGTPNNKSTKFNIGSINKMFTGVGVLQLAERGKLKLDDPIGEHLTGFPAEIASGVTIRQLLAHRSGWGSYWENEYYLSNWSRLRSVSDYMEFIRDIPLDFAPGSSEQYANTGYEVLGAIIESATGSDYYDYVRDNIFRPAGMSDTDSYPSDEVVANLATGYMQDEGGHFNTENTFRHSVRGTPAGGGYSTATDLLKFMTALLDGKLIANENVVTLFNRFAETRVQQELDGGIGFAGGGPGISAVVEMEFDDRLMAIILSNYDPPTAEELGPPIARLARRELRGE